MREVAGQSGRRGLGHDQHEMIQIAHVVLRSTCVQDANLLAVHVYELLGIHVVKVGFEYHGRLMHLGFEYHWRLMHQAQNEEVVHRFSMSPQPAHTSADILTSERASLCVRLEHLNPLF
jgi:phosphate-selective porin